jgi:hypothetical protein
MDYRADIETARKWQRWWLGGASAASVLYVGLVTWWHVAAWPSTPGTMTPNAIGDMLAGSAAPLAFLWLVLGYLLQGAELRMNSLTLQAQVDEMRSQVNESRAQARAMESMKTAYDKSGNAMEVLAESTKARNEIELRMILNRSQPIFLTTSAPREGAMRAVVKNIAATARMVEVHLGGRILHRQRECAEGADMAFLTLDSDFGNECIAKYIDETGSQRSKPIELWIAANFPSRGG